MKKNIVRGAFIAMALVVAIIQFIPAQPVVIPADLPAMQRDAHRLLNFEGIDNFRDLGGYRTEDGRSVRWGRLYRSGSHALATPADLQAVSRLGLVGFIDLRSGFEKAEEPDRLPQERAFEVTEIPVLDEGNQALVRDLSQRIESGDLDDFDPDQLMVEGNRQLASRFSPQYSQFMQAVLAADGQPILWHCTAGKDRAGYAAAILLRTLGVPPDTVLADYMLSADHAVKERSRDLLLLRLFKGADVAARVRTMLGVEAHWLQAAFDQIDKDWGDFDNYRRQALGLSDEQVMQLQAALLE